MSSEKRRPKSTIDISRISVIGNPALTAAENDLPPMPEADVLERQLLGVLESMNIPQAKISELQQQSAEKKWQLVWGQVKFSPGHYLDQLIVHLDALDKQRKKKLKARKLPTGTNAASAILRGIEISLRTNTLSWVKDFVNYEPPVDEKDKSLRRKGGLNILMEYFTVLDDDTREPDDYYLCVLCLRALMNNAFGFTSVMAHPDSINQICLCLSANLIKPARSDVDEDNSYIDDQAQIRRYRTHVLVLELLAAVCLVPKGHARILQAFENYQKVHGERERFLCLLKLLRTEKQNVAVMVTCMAFINVVVHCVPDMNYQVALQEEFAQLGLMTLIDELVQTASPDLKEQIEAYQDNFINVAELAREAEARVQDQQQLEEMAAQMTALKGKMEAEIKRYTEVIASLHKEMGEDKYLIESLTKRLEDEKAARDVDLARLNRDLAIVKQELQAARDKVSDLQAELDEANNLSATLRRLSEEALSSASAQSRSQVALRSTGVQAGGEAEEEFAGFGRQSSDTFQAPPAPVPPPAPPLPPAPLLASGVGTSVPSNTTSAASTLARSARRPVMVDARLPMLNWSVIPDAKITETVFSHINDEEVMRQLDFSGFKQAFRLDTAAEGDSGSVSGSTLSLNSPADGSKTMGRSKTGLEGKPKGPATVLDVNRARNLAIAQRRIGNNMDEIVRAVSELDFKALPSEKADLLRSEFVPTDEEVKLLVAQHNSGKPMAELDEFLYRLSRVPRLRQKLSLMSYLDSCDETLAHVSPQAAAVITAAECLMRSTRLQTVLATVLAYGNYLNSQRRGCALGFKISAFDRLTDTRTRNKEANVLHYVAASLESKYPDALRFMEDLVCLEAAAKVSLFAMEVDVIALERTASAVMDELHNDATHPVLLRFRDKTMQPVEQARVDLNQAKAKYLKVTNYFAEDPAIEATTFFGMFIRMHEAIQQALAENKERVKAQQQLALQAQQARAGGGGGGGKGNAVAGRPSATSMGRRGSNAAALLQGEVGDGDIDTLISTMKGNAYRRPGVESKVREKREIGQAEHFAGYTASRPWLK